MRKAVFGSLVILVLAAFVWASNDPWKGKPYQQWDQKDVRRVLFDSPWAKTVQVDLKGQMNDDMSPQMGGPQNPPGGPGGGAMGGAPGGAGGGAPGPGGGMSTGNPSPQAMGSSPEAGNGPPQASFVVRWLSSRTMREAFVRSAVLSGTMKEDAAEKDVDLPVQDYQVVISGPRMTPFQSMDENAIKEKATLTTKKAKVKIEASRVEIQRAPDGKTVSAIVISFPKRSSTGEATIGAEEKGAEFSLETPKVNIRTGFDFSKMYDAEGRDL